MNLHRLVIVYIFLNAMGMNEWDNRYLYWLSSSTYLFFKWRRLIEIAVVGKFTHPLSDSSWGGGGVGFWLA